METRLKEHIREAELARKNNTTAFRSTVAEHIVLENHTITEQNISLINHIRDSRKLDVAESIEIYKTPNSTLLNRDQGNGYSNLFSMIDNKNKKIRNKNFNIYGSNKTYQSNNNNNNLPTCHNYNSLSTCINNNPPTSISNNNISSTGIPEAGTISVHPTAKNINRTILDFFPQSSTNTEEVCK